MLELNVPDIELYDEKLEAFTCIEGITVVMEHSLVSLSKWEASWRKAFLMPKQKLTPQEIVGYLRSMTITQNVPSAIYRYIYSYRLSEVYDYIEAPMTATTFSKITSKKNREVVTSELLYYWMIVFNIPFTCERWHLNRLLTLIALCNLKQQPDRKMSKAELAQRNSDLNSQRLRELNTRG